MSQDNGQGQKRPDSKGPSGAQSFLWYMLIAALGVMLVAMYVANLTTPEIPYPELVKLIDQSQRDRPTAFAKASGELVVERKRGSNTSRLRYSNLREVRVADRTITGKVDIEVLAPAPRVSKAGNQAFRTNFLPDRCHRHEPRRAAAEEPTRLVVRRGTQHVEDARSVPADHGAAGRLLRRHDAAAGGGAGSPMSFGRSRGRLYAQEDLGVTFDDVAGIDEAVEEVREIVDFLRSPEKYQRLGGRIPKGVLLVGPPGTGKTLLAKAIAGEAGVPFFSLSGSDFVEMFVGVGAARVRDMFQQAEAKAPCIIFIDELDALGKSRGTSIIGGHDEREQTLNALLVEMDGFDSNSGVIVMAATNRPETLDPALLRPGRFDRNVLVDRPDIRGREAILKVHVKNVKLDTRVELQQVAAITPGFVGADLANLVNEATLLAARREKSTVGMKEFNEGVERVTAGLEKKQRVMNEDEKQRVAYHESGHALVAYCLPNTDPGPQGLDHSPRAGRAGLHHAAARRRPLSADPGRIGKPHPGAARRHDRRGDRSTATSPPAPRTTWNEPPRLPAAW